MVLLPVEPAHGDDIAALIRGGPVKKGGGDLVHDDGGFLPQRLRKPALRLMGLENAAVGQGQDVLSHKAENPPGVLPVRVVSYGDHSLDRQTPGGQHRAEVGLGHERDQRRGPVRKQQLSEGADAAEIAPDGVLPQLLTFQGDTLHPRRGGKLVLRGKARHQHTPPAGGGKALRKLEHHPLGPAVADGVDIKHQGPVFHGRTPFRIIGSGAPRGRDADTAH